jgi:GTPase Era involved in 16S rRNA processing
MKQKPADLKSSIKSAEVAKDALKTSGLDASAAKLAEAIAAAKEARFAIGVVGIAKRGKSTLINGLLGRKDDLLAPVDMFPATNVVSCFANHPESKARVIFHGEESATQADDIALEEIKQYACEKFNPGNCKGVKIIEVMGQFPLLGERVVLVDTPGADNASSSVHDLVLLDFMPRLDAVIFLVTADEPLTAAEMELLKRVRHNDVRKLIFAVNKVDKVDAKELSEALAHNRKALSSIGFADAPIFPISAKPFQTEGSDTGVSKLIGAIEGLIGAGRARIMTDRLDDLVRRYLAEARDIIGERLQLSELTADQIREETKALSVARQEYTLSRSKWERQFISSWQAAFGDFENVLEKLEKQMIFEYTALVAKTSVPKLASLAQIVHTDIVRHLDELLEPHLETLNEKLTSASERTASDCVRVMKIAPREAEAIKVSGKPLKGIADIVAAGAPSMIVAAIAGTLPGGISSLIISAAPAVAGITHSHGQRQQPPVQQMPQ